MLEASAIRNNRKAATSKTAWDMGMTDIPAMRSRETSAEYIATTHRRAFRHQISRLNARRSLLNFPCGGGCASQISVSNVGPEAYEKIAAPLQIRKVPHWSASLTQSGEETVSMLWASR